ncbi:hypothetical protein CAter282_0444 [Collimonas arenae]|uniref:Uncharacterized protein n=1 Tax=Collimonas arenae TaxID=279058 RepID=A0A127PLS4_9BURK|nr:hypothetical protein CAter10_0475 [Collimonas arenae]AMP08260.1 hypothetical protein CAter282_0444 [Collimonas arenae]
MTKFSRAKMKRIDTTCGPPTVNFISRYASSPARNRLIGNPEQN